MSTWNRIMMEHPALRSVFKYLVPKPVKEQSANMGRYCAETARKRIAQGPMEEWKDFLSFIPKCTGEKSLTDDEIDP
jgi:hypothetical protein